MTSWSANLQRLDSSFAVLVRIEGVGDAAGLWTFCSARPAYGDASFLPFLKRLPQPLSERVNFGGGAPEASGVTIEMVDVGDRLTELVATEEPPFTILEEDVAPGDVGFLVGRSAGLTGRPIWVGSEAMLVTAESAGPDAVVVTRGRIGTEALRHRRGDPVYLAPNYFEGRRFTMSFVPLDGEPSDEREVGTFVLQRLAWSDDLNVWILQGRSQARYLDRLAPVAPREAIARVVSEAEAVVLEPAGTFQPLWPDLAVHVWNERTGEIAALDPRYNTTGQVMVLRDRALFGTRRAAAEQGDVFRQVFLAGRDLRYSPGPSPSSSRSSGAWEPAVHWLDQLLILLLSSADEADGLELTNARTTGSAWSRSNFSSLPPGFGAGLPHTLINWEAAEDLRARTWDWQVPYFVYGHGRDTFMALGAREFLRPLGAFLSFELGRIRFGRSRAPMAGEASSLSISPANIVRRKVDRGVYLPDLNDVSRDKAELVGAVTYKVGPSGLAATYSNGNMSGTYGQRGWYGAAEPPIEIPFPGGDPARAERYGLAAASLLFRAHRPPVQIGVRVDAALFEAALAGVLADVTLPELPNMRGSRGWAGVVAEIMEREPRLESAKGGQASGATLWLRLRRYAESLRLGRIAPSAHVSGVAGDVATVLDGRYTRTDTPGGLPLEDQLAFDVGDMVRLINPDGSPAAAGVEDIRDITADEITLSGNFGGSLAPGLVLTTADADDATPEQRARYVFAADMATQTIGTTADQVWRWGEV